MKIKKLSAILLAGALMASPAVMPAVMAESSQTIEMDESGNVVDPSGNLRIEGTTVYGLTEKGQTETEIVIPEGITIINRSAFSRCNNIESVIFSDSVTEICNNAFTECWNLRSVTFGKNLKTIGRTVFQQCENLTSVNIPEGVTLIDRYAFRHCTSLESITIPESVDTIGGLAFEGTPWLDNKRKENPLVVVNNNLIDGLTCTDENIVIPDGVTRISDHVFQECTNIKSVVIPDGVTYIGWKAFANCTNLTDINIPKSVTGLLTPFIGTPWLENKQKENPLVIVNNIVIDGTTCKGDVVVPDGVTILPFAVFIDNTEITSVKLPSGITTISGNLFDGCKNLESVNIPEGVTSIELAAFRNCEKLTSITLPDSLTSIGDEAFNATKLTSINLPKSITSISLTSFDNCTELKDVYYEGTEEDFAKIDIGYRSIFNDTVTIHYGESGESTPPEESSSTDFSDEETKVTVSVPQELAESALKEATLAVEQVENTDEDSKDVTFDISFKDKEGKAVSLDENTTEITVQIPVPETLKSEEKLYVYYVDDNGKYTNMNAEVLEGGIIEFKTTHFSKYVVTTDGSLAETTDTTDSETTSDNSTAETETDSNSSNSGAASPETGAAGLPITLGVLAIAGAAVVVSKKKTH